jgi:hypothetical protein
MARYSRSVRILLLLLIPITAGVAYSLPAAAQRSERFEVAELYLELNDTDGDLGIHSLIDGGPWTQLAIESPDDRTVLDVLSRGSLRQQGLTELFFESAEPSFDELAPAEFLRRFPEGRYEIEGRSQDGREIQSTVTLSHVLAAAPENILVSGIPAAETCDSPVLPVVAPPVVLQWDPVSQSHPTLGRPGPVKVVRYQLVVEREGVKLSVDLPPAVRRFAIPTDVTDLGEDFKFEIIVRTTTGNNTAVESCFVVQ